MNQTLTTGPIVWGSPRLDTALAALANRTLEPALLGRFNGQDVANTAPNGPPDTLPIHRVEINLQEVLKIAILVLVLSKIANSYFLPCKAVSPGKLPPQGVLNFFRGPCPTNGGGDIFPTADTKTKHTTVLEQS